jgi:SAM-dependent methyltransferase
MTAKLNVVAIPTSRSSHTSPMLTSGSRTAQADPRWPAIVAALASLRDERRHAIRIVDADCACGTLLIAVAHHARALGFTAIEVRGIDGSPAMIGRARAAAARLRDPVIGFVFETTDMVEALAAEAEFPADIVLWHGSRQDDNYAGVQAALAAAGDLVIGDTAMRWTREQAA